MYKCNKRHAIIHYAVEQCPQCYLIERIEAILLRYTDDIPVHAGKMTGLLSKLVENSFSAERKAIAAKDEAEVALAMATRRSD